MSSEGYLIAARRGLDISLSCPGAASHLEQLLTNVAKHRVNMILRSSLSTCSAETTTAASTGPVMARTHES